MVFLIVCHCFFLASRRQPCQTLALSAWCLGDDAYTVGLSPVMVTLSTFIFITYVFYISPSAPQFCFATYCYLLVHAGWYLKSFLGLVSSHSPLRWFVRWSFWARSWRRLIFFNTDSCVIFKERGHYHWMGGSKLLEGHMTLGFRTFQCIS